LQVLRPRMPVDRLHILRPRCALRVRRSTAGLRLDLWRPWGWTAGRALRITGMGWPANAAQKKGPEGPLVLFHPLIWMRAHDMVYPGAVGRVLV